MNRTLITYYSFSGNTRIMAENIATQVSGTLLEIVPTRSYAFDYNTAAKEARVEITRGFCPELVSGGQPINGYDVVFIGTPNWFKSLAPPVLSFVRGHDFSNKTVVPFCTHGGGGFGKIEERIAEECIGAKILSGLAISGTAENREILDWLKIIEIVK